MKITAFSRLRKIIRDKEDPIDFFTDPVFSNTLNNVAQIVSERYGNFPISVQMEWDNNDQRIASTNNSHIFINLDNSIVHAINGLEKKYVAYLGFLGHELGHVLYTDFNVCQKQSEALYADKRWYPSRPQNANVDAFEGYCFAGKIPLSLFSQVFHAITNIVEDYYVNYKMGSEWPGLFRDGIAQTQAQMWKQYPKPDDEIMSGLSGCINTFHQLLVQQDCPAELKQRFPMLIGVEDVGSCIIEMDDYLDRAMLCNELFLLTWPELKKFIDDNCANQQPQQQNQSGQGNGAASQSGEDEDGGSTGTDNANDGTGQAGNSDTSDSGNDKTTENACDNEADDDGTDGEQSSADAGNTTGPQSCAGIQSSSDAGSGKGVLVDTNSQKSNSDQSNEAQADSATASGSMSDQSEGHKSNSDPGKDFADDALAEQLLQEAINEYLRGLARKEPEKIQELERELSVKDAATGVHAGVGYRLNSVARSSYLKEVYDRRFFDLKRISKRMQNAIAEVFEERLNGTMDNGLLFGNRIHAAASASGDGRIFRRRTMPDDGVDIAVSLLIDQSGSMSGSRIDKAQEMAMLVEDFCRGLNIPVSIVGHNVPDTVQMYQYVDFDDTSREGKYKLLYMSAGGCNRDGLPLRYCVNRLLQRDESNKLMILVSDGKPNDDNYRGQVAFEDLRQIKRECDRKGIILLAAAIGDDKQQIHQIYGNSFLDITDLNTLPIKIVRTIKQFI